MVYSISPTNGFEFDESLERPHDSHDFRSFGKSSCAVPLSRRTTRVVEQQESQSQNSEESAHGKKRERAVMADFLVIVRCRFEWLLQVHQVSVLLLPDKPAVSVSTTPGDVSHESKRTD